MKIKYFAFAVFALLLGLAACRKDDPDNTEDPVNNDPNQTEEVESTPIVFTATADGGWEGVTSVAVMIDGTVKEYSVSDVDNTSATLSSDDPHYWPESENVSVTAWSPYTAGETSVPDVVVNADQSTADGFAASYFISAEDQTVQSDAPTLVFTNRTARVFVTLTDLTENPASVKLTNLSGSPTEIVMYAYDEANFSYLALVAPQTVAEGTDFITCELDNGGAFACQMSEATEWVAGEEYTYTFSLSEAEELDYSYDSSTNTYTVYTANGLNYVSELVNDGTNTINITLDNDIDLTDIEWTAIGKNTSRYTGTFDGGGHTITGMTINKNNTDYQALIGYLDSGGKVQNVVLENVNITGYMYAGGVVGMNNGGIVTACSVSGSITASSNAGGVVGRSESGTVTACYASGSISGVNVVSGSLGGVVGYNDSYSTVTACYFASTTDSITGNSSSTGGVVGRNAGTVSTCYWSVYDGNAFGSSSTGSGDATKVDGTDVTWEDTVDKMNEAIDSWNEENSDNPDKQCSWKYELLEGNTLPTLKQN